MKDIINAEKYSYTKILHDDYNFFQIMGHGTENYYSHKQKPYEIEYVLPHTIDKEGSQLYIPDLIILLKTNDIIKKTFNFTELYNPVIGPNLNISFEDISGNKKKVSFESSFVLKSISLRTEGFDYEIVVTFKRSEGWKHRTLQWIRDGYAEWVRSLN